MDTPNRFRFRVWYKNEMRYPPSLDEELDQEDFDFFREYQRGTPMMSTGLIDSKGKEIFEGDIVALTSHGHPYNEVVEFVTYRGTLALAPFHDFDVDHRLSSDQRAEECEVIGNIYESPDLLPGAQQ